MNNPLLKSKTEVVKTITPAFLKRPAILSSAAIVAALLVAGCASDKKTTYERGWIGGDYRLAKAHPFPPPQLNPGSPLVRYTNFPSSAAHARKAGVFVRELDTNTPAALAGLRKGDLIMELDDHPVTSLRAFHRTVDQAKPGAPLAVTAYRDGQKVECRVNVGREKYEHYGVFAMSFPTVVHGWDLWPNPDLSFVFVGWETSHGLRHELGSAHDVSDQHWSAWLAVFELMYGDRVLSQTNMPTTTTWLPSALAENR